MTRVPPNDLPAEEALLGAMMYSRTALDEALAVCTVADFYKPAHGHVFAAARTLSLQGEPVDPVTVASQLTSDGLSDQVGGLQALIGLQAGGGSNAGRYARIVADRALLRRVIAAATEITDLAYGSPADAAGALDDAQALLFALGAARRHGSAIPVGEALVEWLEELEAMRAGDGPVGQPTGWSELDTMLLGLHAGQLVTVAARPSMGKTACGLALAHQVAAAGAAAVFVSAEMGLRDLLTRLVANTSQVDSQALRSGHLAERDMPRVSGAASDMFGLPLHLVDDPAASLGSIRSETRRLANAPGGIGLVVVDYLQLLDAEAGAENRQVEVATLCRGLKRLARELAVPVVCLAQLNRNLENRANKRPTLADIRESGEVENASDVVIGLYRDEYYDAESADRGILEVIVLKQRNGPVGTVRLAYNERYGSIRNMARQEAI